MSDTEDTKKEEEVAPDDEATEKESRGEEETETPEESADEEDSQNEAIETIEDSSDEADSSSDQNGAKNGECLRNGSIKATEEETGSEACALPQKRKSEALGTEEEEVESSEKKAKAEEEAPEAESTA